MNISIGWEELRQRKLMVATPMYGGMCTGQYMKSMLGLIAYCAQNGIQCQTHFLFNESLVQRARNFLTDTFMQSDCTHLMFIDADIGFEPADVMALMALQDANPENDEYDVISAPYPKKCISWEKVKIAVDKGVADEDPALLENYVGDFVFNPIWKGKTYQVNLSEPVEISEAGTGFMMIRRTTLDKFREKYPEQNYRPDSPRSELWDGEREITAFFDCIIEPETRRYLSEDFMFCHYVRKIGMKVWMCPWIHLSHFGTYNFSGSLPHLAGIGADPTSELHTIAKIKQKTKK
jgi:hypothetical protein